MKTFPRNIPVSYDGKRLEKTASSEREAVAVVRSVNPDAFVQTVELTIDKQAREFFFEVFSD